MFKSSRNHNYSLFHYKSNNNRIKSSKSYHTFNYNSIIQKSKLSVNLKLRSKDYSRTRFKLVKNGSASSSKTTFNGGQRGKNLGWYRWQNNHKATASSHVIANNVPRIVAGLSKKPLIARNVWIRNDSKPVIRKKCQYKLVKQPPKTSNSKSHVRRSLTSKDLILIRGIRYERCGNVIRRLSESNSSRLLNASTINTWTKPVTFRNDSHIRRIVNRARLTLTKRDLVKNKQLNRKYCLYYCRYGRCNKQDSCKFVHDPDKVAVCTRFLRGTCKVNDCPFSHQIAPEKMPVCCFYLEGRCNNDQCPYRHVNVSRDAEICSDFTNGYCSRGNQCKNVHLFVCKNHFRAGNCSDKSCSLPHLRIVNNAVRIDKKRLKPGQTKAKSRKRLRKSTVDSSLTDSSDSKTTANLVPVNEANSKLNSSLPHFIPLHDSCDSETASEQLANDSEIVNEDRRELRESKYFWIEDDDSDDQLSDNLNQENFYRPPIQILPKFLLD